MNSTAFQAWEESFWRKNGRYPMQHEVWEAASQRTEQQAAEPSAWEAFKQTPQYQYLALGASQQCQGGFTENGMRQAFQAGERYGEERGKLGESNG